VWSIEKKSFSAREYAEIHIQRLVFDSKKDILKIIVLKIQMMNIFSNAFSRHRILFF
jgi:hypothetical protein